MNFTAEQRRFASISGHTLRASYITHSQHDLLRQRIYQIGCSYEDGNDSNSLRHGPMFNLVSAACHSMTPLRSHR